MTYILAPPGLNELRFDIGRCDVRIYPRRVHQEQRRYNHKIMALSKLGAVMRGGIKYYIAPQSLNQNMGQRWNAQKSSHTRPSQASYCVFIVSILKKRCHVIQAVHCRYSTANFLLYLDSHIPYTLYNISLSNVASQLGVEHEYLTGEKTLVMPNNTSK